MQPKRRITIREAERRGAIKPLKNAKVYLIREDEDIHIYSQTSRGSCLLKYLATYPAELWDRPIEYKEVHNNRGTTS